MTATEIPFTQPDAPYRVLRRNGETVMDYFERMKGKRDRAAAVWPNWLNAADRLFERYRQRLNGVRCDVAPLPPLTVTDSTNGNGGSFLAREWAGADGFKLRLSFYQTGKDGKCLVSFGGECWYPDRDGHLTMRDPRRGLPNDETPLAFPCTDQTKDFPANSQQFPHYGYSTPIRGEDPDSFLSVAGFTVLSRYALYWEQCKLRVEEARRTGGQRKALADRVAQMLGGFRESYAGTVDYVKMQIHPGYAKDVAVFSETEGKLVCSIDLEKLPPHVIEAMVRAYADAMRETATNAA